MRLRDWIVAAIALLLGRGRGPAQPPTSGPADGDGARSDDARATGDGRIIPEAPPDRRGENLVLAFLGLSVLAAWGFIVVYVVYPAGGIPNALLGACMGVSLVAIGIALTIVAKRLVVTEEIEEDYPSEHPEAQAEIVEMVHEAGSGITRKRLLLFAGGATGGALTLAAGITTVSLGPIWDTAPLEHTPWYRGRRVVDELGRPLRAADILQNTFYSGFPEGADTENLASPLIIVRLPEDDIHLPAGRGDWSPGGILAYSKICTHAGCAIELYRKPTFPQAEPRPAFVCPCHYSTFNPADGAQVIYGPAGRPLPQLPLMIDASGHLRAGGNFSARVGPSWWGVRFSPSDGPA